METEPAFFGKELEQLRRSMKKYKRHCEGELERVTMMGNIILCMLDLFKIGPIHRRCSK